jgi:hypothetical protein
MDSAAPLQAAGPQNAAVLGLVYRRDGERRAPAVPPNEAPRRRSPGSTLRVATQPMAAPELPLEAAVVA